MMTLESKLVGPDMNEIENELQQKIEAINLYQEDL